MKKKGLIISTVVMVVVLIAALTTATYAWFTAADSVKVDSISLSVKSSAKVNVGVKVGADMTYNSYRNGEMSPVDADEHAEGGWGNTVSWAENPNVGLASSLTFNGLNLGRDKAIGSCTTNDSTKWGAGEGKTAFDTTTLVLGTTKAPKYIVKAKGQGTNIDYATAALADANRDYLDATIGIEANDANVTGTYVKVTVKTTDSNPTLGINASVHFIIIIGNKYIDLQPFGTAKNTALKSEQKDTSVPTAEQGYRTYSNSQATSTFYFWVSQGTKNSDDTYGALGIGGTEISDFRILAYIDGADPDCVKDATGGCTIDIEFDGTKDTKCEKLGNTDQTPVSSVKFINEKLKNLPAQA